MQERLVSPLSLLLVGLVAISSAGVRAEAPASSVLPELAGQWTYRSFLSDPDVTLPFDRIRFGAGILSLQAVRDGMVTGRLSFGDQFGLAVRGSVGFGEPITLRFQGSGDRPGTDGWVYDYVGYYVPAWPGGVGQRPAIVGTVIRSVGHSDGQAPSGVVASWIALKQDVSSANQERVAAAPAAAAPAGEHPEAQALSRARHEALERLRRQWIQLYERRSAAPEALGEPEAARDADPPSPQRLDLVEGATAPFRAPDEIRSRDGELHATLVVDYAHNQIGDDAVRLRSYNGDLVGPTLRAHPGDTLYITIRNQLPAEPGNGLEHNGHHGWNTTNLHTHGLHVSPSGNSDNVLLQIEPGESQEYEIEVPEDHPAGTFWYHAHKHGSVSSQVSSGMAGALIIEGGMDEVPEIAAARERTMVLQQIPYWNEGLSEGVIELPYVDRMFGPGAWDRLGRYTTVNGVQLPVIDMRPGEVQRWRLVNSGFREVLNLKLARAEGTLGPEELTLHEIAVDGLSLGRVEAKPIIEIWPGNRSDVLVRAPEIEAGEYYVVDERTEAADSLNGLPEPRKYVARVVIGGALLPMSLPASAALSSFRLPSIDPSEITGTQTAVYGINFVGGALTFGIDGRAHDPANVRVLRLGDVEEWTLTSSNNVGQVHHPFHIHVNPFEVVSMKDSSGVERLEAPVWRDTIVVRGDWTVKFRTRYRRFTGRFVQHCHILDHEDMGMMELVEIR